MFKAIQRFLRSMIGVEQSNLMLPVAGQPTSMEQRAADLVERSRQGDQNAIGTICAVRDQALKGNPKSQRGLTLIVAYGKAHPMPKGQYAGMGQEGGSHSDVRSPTSTRTEVRSPTSTRTEVRSPTSTATHAYTQGNFTSTVTGGAGAGATSVTIHLPGFLPGRQTRQTTFGEELALAVKTDALMSQVDRAFQEQDYCAVMFDLIPQIARHSVNKAIVAIADGPSLLRGADMGTEGVKPRILEVAEMFKEENERKAFSLGVKHSEAALVRAHTHHALDPACKEALIFGFLLGKARRLQAVRTPECPVSVLCPMVGWELGE